jgi:putative endonuclease
MIIFDTGMTNNFKRRAHEHKARMGSEFTKKFNVNKLVYFEVCSDIRTAIAREKQLKGGSRKKKIDLINNMNPEWVDLYDVI